MTYFNQKNNFSHGIMFHHFHDKKNFIKTQGSITGDQLVKIIKYIGRENIINARAMGKTTSVTIFILQNII